MEKPKRPEMPKMTTKLPSQMDTVEKLKPGISQITIFHAVIRKRIKELKEEKAKFIPVREAELRVLQQKIQEEQNQLATLMNEGNAKVVGFDSAIKELEQLLGNSNDNSS